MDKIDIIIDTSEEWYHENVENHVILSILLNKEQNIFSSFVGGMEIEDMANLVYSYMVIDEKFVTAVRLALKNYDYHGKNSKQ